MPSASRVLRSVFVLGLTALVATSGGRQAQACPFCNSVSMTLSEEIKATDVAVLARLVARPEALPNPEGGAAPLPSDAQEAVFEVIQVLKGQEALGETKQIEVLYFGQHPEDTRFLVFGTDPKRIVWSTPTALSERGVEYLSKLPELPAAGAERLAFFQEYLEDSDELLSRDSYDEFAKAPYADVKLLRDQMHRDRLLTWIQDPDVSVTHRRLYLTMLGICGQPEDVPTLETMLKSSDRRMRSALDAMIACYVILKGPEGLTLVEDLFLKQRPAKAASAEGEAQPASSPEYVDTYSAVMAVRFLGQESDVIPKERLMESMRYLLDQPSLADLIIPDLARWQDWSVMDRLVDLFKNATEESSWVRVPVINYLRACPLPEAKQHMAELAKIDPDAVKRATSFFPLAAAKPAAPATDAAESPAASTTADAGNVEPEEKVDPDQALAAAQADQDAFDREDKEDREAAASVDEGQAAPPSDAADAEAAPDSAVSDAAMTDGAEATAATDATSDAASAETSGEADGAPLTDSAVAAAAPEQGAAADRAAATGSTSSAPSQASTPDGGPTSFWTVYSVSAAAGAVVLILLFVILRGARGPVSSH